MLFPHDRSFRSNLVLMRCPRARCPVPQSLVSFHADPCPRCCPPRPVPVPQKSRLVSCRSMSLFPVAVPVCPSPCLPVCPELCSCVPQRALVLVRPPVSLSGFLICLPFTPCWNPFPESPRIQHFNPPPPWTDPDPSPPSTPFFFSCAVCKTQALETHTAGGWAGVLG